MINSHRPAHLSIHCSNFCQNFSSNIARPPLYVYLTIRCHFFQDISPKHKTPPPKRQERSVSHFNPSRSDTFICPTGADIISAQRGIIPQSGISYGAAVYHSCLIAVRALILTARLAGEKPETSPTSVANATAPIASHQGMIELPPIEVEIPIDISPPPIPP